MNYGRFLIVGFVVALAAFSFYNLSAAGSDYKVLTTSDSGYFYGIAEDMNQQDGMIDVYDLSHPPQGKSIPKSEQFQPLLLTVMYRGFHALDSGISLMTVCQYFSPLLFALAVIGAFLAARELGGDLAGCASSLFISTLVGSIYWTKIGAFDREITLIFFGTWLFYLLAKIFRGRGMEVLKYSAIAGLFYGLFLLTWSGAPFIAAVFGFALVLVVLEKAVSGLGLTITGIILFVLGTNFSGFDIPEFIGVFVFLVGLAKIAKDWDSLKSIESSLISSIKRNSWLIGGIITIFVVSTLMAMFLGGESPTFWSNIFGESIPSFLGFGGEAGVSFPRIATEMAAVSPSPGGYLAELGPKLYNNSALTGITIFLVMVGAVKIFWKSKRSHLMILSWLIIIAPMPLSQARFFRLFWPMWPILAGFGFASLIWMFREVGRSPSFSSFDWVNRFRKPLVLALVGGLLIIPFIQNVRADHNSSDTVPYPHGASLPTNFYHSLLDSFNCIEENTPENSVLVIPWSYGHFATGATGRPSVTDGAQTMGWRDEWRDSPGIKPPDYIKYISGDKGYIIGKNASVEPYQINGRRIDVQRMMTIGDENEFAWIVNTYRENFGIGMDYIIFNNSVMGAGSTTFQQTLLSISENLETTSTVRENDSKYIISFKSENIVFDFRQPPVTEEDNKKLGGYIYYNTDTGRLMSYSFTDSPERSKILWVFFNNQQSITGAGLADFKGIPMFVRALGGEEMPDYLKHVYRSPHGQAEVYKIVHENIPRYLPS